MKPVILSLLLVSSSLLVKAQNVSALATGKYEVKTKAASKWDKGDVILLDDSHYRLSGNNEVGEYRFSVAAQRVFFTSGPLKSAFTKVTTKSNQPVIIFPAEQNQDLGLTSEVWASKQ
ncbi:MAG TPA: hypothetical protein VFL47_17495 [Flavisolibacter sp.]|nr:hypothetical protein [Flavisolibacter sp.]